MILCTPIGYPRRTSPPRVCSSRGSVLLLVLVAIIIMTLTTSTYMMSMRNEHLAARHHGTRQQAELLVDSGVEYLKLLLGQTLEDIQLEGGLLSNPNSLQDVIVIDDPLAIGRGRFTILTPDMTQGYYAGVRYGLENESAKLNLNSLLVGEDSGGLAVAEASSGESLTPRDRLMLLPGMQEEIADAILDWLDEDDSQRINGAELDYYQGLNPPYQPRNGPLQHLDELLLVRGVTPELLYGLDVNRNFQIDANEIPSATLAQIDNTNGEMDRGWSAYLTVYGWESNLGTDGEPKIDVNSEDLETLHADLSQALGEAEANFIIAYRQQGSSDANGDNNNGSNNGGGQGAGGGGAGGGGSGGFGGRGGGNNGQNGGGGGNTNSADSEPISAEQFEVDFEKQASTTITSLLDLIDAEATVQGEENEPSQTVSSPWQDQPTTFRQSFAELLDVATADSAELVAGRININQASLLVLMTIPGMTEATAEQIVSRREPEVDRTTSEQRHAIWLVADSLVTLEEFKQMAKHVTTGGDVYRCQVVGYFEEGTNQTRSEVLLDRSQSPAVLLERRDLGNLGASFSRGVISAITPELTTTP